MLHFDAITFANHLRAFFATQDRHLPRAFAELLADPASAHIARNAPCLPLRLLEAPQWLRLCPEMQDTTVLYGASWRATAERFGDDSAPDFDCDRVPHFAR